MTKNLNKQSINMEESFITIRNTDVIKRINLHQILFILIDCDCLTFRFEDGKQFLCSKSMREISNELPYWFIRIHRNCIVNSLYISELKVKRRTIILLNGTELDVSFRNMKTLVDTLN